MLDPMADRRQGWAMTRMHINENSKTFSPFGRATAYGRFSRSDVGVVRYVLTLCFLVIAGCQVAQRDFSRAVPPTPAASQVLRGAWRDLDEAVNSACADKNVMMAVIESDRWALATHYTLLQARMRDLQKYWRFATQRLPTTGSPRTSMWRCEWGGHFYGIPRPRPLFCRHLRTHSIKSPGRLRKRIDSNGCVGQAVWTPG